MSAGYSGTPLVAKLGLREGARLLVVREPAELQSALGPLPDGVERTQRLASADVAIVFVTRKADLAREAGRLAANLADDAALWIAWPKKSSGVATDVTEQTGRDLLLPLGLVDNKVCAIDATWSGLRFVRRVELRAGAATRVARRAKMRDPDGTTARPPGSKPRRTGRKPSAATRKERSR